MASKTVILNKISKKTRKRISLEVKLNIIKQLEQGEKICNVAKHYHLNESSIRTIKKNSENIKKSIEEAIPTSYRVVKYIRNSIIVKMEKLLIQWIEDNNKKNIGMDTHMIQAKAISIFNHLKNQEENEEKTLSFVASKGWFDKFKKRYNLHNIKITGEPVNAEKHAANEFLNTFKHFIDGNDYTPPQEFDNDETELLVKRMPTRTFVSKEEIIVPDLVQPSLNEIAETTLLEPTPESEEYQEDNKEEIQKLIRLQNTKITTENIELKNKSKSQEQEISRKNQFTVENIKTFISMIQESIDFIESIDPDEERVESVRKGLTSHLAPYELILDKRKGFKSSRTTDESSDESNCESM